MDGGKHAKKNGWKNNLYGSYQSYIKLLKYLFSGVGNCIM